MSFFLNEKISGLVHKWVVDSGGRLLVVVRAKTLHPLFEKKRSVVTELREQNYDAFYVSFSENFQQKNILRCVAKRS